jgi:hypothetical protein
MPRFGSRGGDALLCAAAEDVVEQAIVASKNDVINSAVSSSAAKRERLPQSFIGRQRDLAKPCPFETRAIVSPYDV